MKKRTLSALASLLLAANAIAQTALPSVEEVYNIFKNKCISCHSNASPAGGLNLEGTGTTNLSKAINVAGKLVNKNPGNAHATSVGDKLVYPGRPDRSFLFRKVNQGFESTYGALHVSEGSPMPGYPNNGALEPVEKETIRQWILYGSKTTGTQFNKALVADWFANNGIESFPDGPPPAPAPGEGFQVKMGPFFLPPDGEVEYYIKHELKLPADVEVARLDIKFSPFSHHFIIYNFNTAGGAAFIPHGLRLNANHSDINLTAAVQEQIDLRLPATTAFRWSKDIILDLNSHFINYSLTRPFQCEAYVNVYTQPIGTAKHEMKASLLVNPNIPIPNNGNSITHSAAEFDLLADSIYIWGLMGHTHKYGTGYKVWKRLPSGQKGDMLYDAACPQGVPDCVSPNFDYRHIPMRYWLPLLPIKWGHGIIHEASWVNDGPSPVSFGPTSDDEMQVLIAFYTENPVFVGDEEPLDADARSVKTYPNPTDASLTFALPEGQTARNLQISDLAGRAVLQMQNIEKQVFTVDVRALPAGIYFFKLDGRTGKIVVE